MLMTRDALLLGLSALLAWSCYPGERRGVDFEPDEVEQISNQDDAQPDDSASGSDDAGAPAESPNASSSVPGESMPDASVKPESPPPTTELKPDSGHSAMGDMPNTDGSSGVVPPPVLVEAGPDQPDPPGTGGVLSDASVSDAGHDETDPSDADLPDADPPDDDGPADPDGACVVDCGCPPGLMGAECDQWEFVDVTAGKMHTCGLLSDGRVLCWGNDDFKQVSQAPMGNDFVSLQSGGVYSCGVRRDDTIYCWGSPAFGILSVPPEPVISLETGWDAACAELSPGLYDCWGNDGVGASPDGGTWGKYSGRPSGPVQDLRIGWQQGCALLLDGSIDCWGANEYKQASPPAEKGFVELSLASWHGCARKEDGSVHCWGSNINAPPAPIKSMDSRGLSTCAIMLDDSIRCWGAGGALQPPSGVSAKKLAVGDGHSCALLMDNSIVCWGDVSEGAHLVPEVPALPSLQ